MNTTQLAEDLAKAMDLPKSTCREMVNFVFNQITKKVAKGQKVKITGFGSFYRTTRKARTGRNPQNGAPVEIEAKRVPRFKAGKKFKDMM